MSGSDPQTGGPADGPGGHRTGRGWLIAVVATAVALVATGIATIAVRSGTGGAAAPPPTTSPTTTVPKGPLTVVATTPADGATGVASDATLSVRFSDPVSTSSPRPTLTPPVAGTWQTTSADTLTFEPAAPLDPSTAETLTVPAGAGGVTSTAGTTLAQPATVHFSVAPGSTLRLQELLAQLGYLPLSFTPTGAAPAPQQAAQDQPGTFAWRWPEPAPLQAQWTQGQANTITRGAVMAFEDQHGLATDGIAGPEVWRTLLAASAAGTADTAPYDYVYVSKTLPETVTVYSNGKAVYSTPANTGVPAAATASGTFPVYLRYKVTTMSGTNPDGTKYHDPGIPWVSYFNGGDALHGFIRPGYGYPQSDGCVEMPPANAAVVYPLTPIGTLVTVS